MTAAVQDIRAFNRFYTAKVGLLQKRFLDSELSFPEARVLFELGRGHAETAADLVRRLGMDKGHVSRILERFGARKLVAKRPCPTHGKRVLLSLTEDGAAAFAEIDKRQEAETGRMIEGLRPAEKARLAGSMRAIEALLGEARRQEGAVTLRDPRPGELAFAVARQAAIYHEEYGWGPLLEATCLRVVAELLETFDPAREQAWIAELGGEIVGSVLLTRSYDPKVGKLRLLYVEAATRGRGVGSLLVEACVGKARAAGYERLGLWTHSVLEGAIRIYLRAGFRLVREETHDTFGPALTGRFYELEL